jgi:hypothetical protein
VETDESRTSVACNVLIQADNATSVQPFRVDLEVGYLGFWQWDALFASLFAIAFKSGTEELGGSGGERFVDDEVFLLLVTIACAHGDGLEELVTTPLSVIYSP